MPEDKRHPHKKHFAPVDWEEEEYQKWLQEKQKEPAWLEDDGKTFLCRACRRKMPVEEKSMKRPGYCRLCRN